MKGKITKLSDNIPDGFRMIATFVVQRIVSREYLDDGAMTVVFNTENSTYKLEEL